MPEGLGLARGDWLGFAARAAVISLALLLSTIFVASLGLCGQASVSAARQVQYHLERAQAALKSNRPDVATRELRAALVLDPRNSQGYGNLGVIAFFRGDCPAASADFRRALAIKPDMARAKALLGVCEMRSGNPGGQALLESSFPELKGKKLRTEIGIELEDAYYREGDLGRAASLARTLVNLDPDNIDVLYMAQRIYSELADDTLNKLVLLAPGSARMQEVIAERMVNEGDIQGAISHYEKVLEIDPRLPGVHLELGEAILQESSHDPKAQARAEAEFETAERTGGDSPGIESQLGRIALLQLKPDRALAHYRRALELSPTDSQAALGMGTVLLSLKRPEEAVKYLRVAAGSDPLSSEAHYQLAIAYRDLHLTAKAQKEMRMFTEINKALDQVRSLYRQMNRPEFPGHQSGSAASK